jgi:hypothetical protein
MIVRNATSNPNDMKKLELLKSREGSSSNGAEILLELQSPAQSFNV